MTDHCTSEPRSFKGGNIPTWSASSQVICVGEVRPSTAPNEIIPAPAPVTDIVGQGFFG